MSKALYSPYKNFKGKEKFDTIIIGSGISGLALGSILSKANHKVLVLERHYTPGGLTHTFTRNDYEWDVGVHYVGEVGTTTILKKAYDYVCETPIEWTDMGDVYERVYFGDKSYEFRKGEQNFLDYFSNLFPDEKESLKKYVQLLIELEIISRGYYMEKVIPNFASWLIGKWLRKKYIKIAEKSTKEVMDGFFKDKKLKAILTAQFGDFGLTPAESSFAMHAAVARHYLEGGFYPKGGSAIFFEKIAPVIIKGGGKILVRAEVSEIIVKNGKAIGVKMQDGNILNAKRIVSTIGTENTYKDLLSEDVRSKLDLPVIMKGLTQSTSYYCLYLGFKHTAEELDLPKNNLWIFPDGYDHDKSMNDFKNGTSNNIPVVYISFPGAKDSDFQNRYPGKSTIEIITLVNYESVEKWEDGRWMKRGDDYEAMKEKISEELLSYLYKYLPQTKDKVDYYELSTPLSVKHFMGNHRGELYGLNHNAVRFLNKWLKPRTPIKNLFLAGQDIVTAGVAGGLMSAVLCATVIEFKNYFSKIKRS